MEPQRRFIPFDRWVFESPLAPDQVLQRIRDNTASGWRPGSNKKLFWGSVGKDSFRVARVTKGRNSFAPLAATQLTATSHGTTLTITLRMHRAVSIGVVVGVPVFGFNAMVELASHRHYGDAAALGAMSLFLVGMASWGFWSDVPKLKATLSELLEANDGTANN